MISSAPFWQAVDKARQRYWKVKAEAKVE